MNHLKYVLGFNVPCRVPSNAAIASRYSHQSTICLKRRSKPRLQKSDRSLSLKPRLQYAGHRVNYSSKTIDRKAATLSAQQKNKIRQTVISQRLDRNTSAECFQRPSHRYSTCQVVKCTGCGNRNSQNERISKRVEDLKDLATREQNVVAVAGKIEPDSYAKLIANYCDAMYVKSTSGIFRDNLSPTVGNEIRRSPFGTLSVMSLKRRNVAERNNSPFQGAKFSTDGTSSGYHSDNPNILEVINTEAFYDLGKSTSYATMIAKYSNAFEFAGGYHVPSNSLTTKSSLSGKFENLSTTGLGGNFGKQSDTASAGKPNHSRVSANGPEVGKQNDWLTKVESVIKDLQRATARKEVIGVKSAKRLDVRLLDSVNERAHWLERVIKAHKKRFRGEEANVEAKALNKSEHKKGEMSKYVGGGTDLNALKKTPLKASNVGPKVPQVELRMRPSQDESIVAINVDRKSSSKPFEYGDAADTELSITVRSSKNSGGKTEMIQQSGKMDFGSMRISITEESVPLKQIEFSINGKPVSELKSIVTRAGKLDVVSSVDKVEIMVPFSKNDARLSNESAKAAAKTVPEQVLNLHIAANLNDSEASNPSTDKEPMKVTSFKSAQSPRSRHVFQTVGKDENAAKGIVADDNLKRSDDSWKIDKVEKPGTLSESKLQTRSENIKINKEMGKGANRDKEILLRKSNQSSRDSPGKSSFNIGNSGGSQPSDHRTPSNMIPWWSSEDSFNKIKKKENPKSMVAASTTRLKDVTVAKEIRKSVELLNSQKPDKPLNPDAAKPNKPVETLKEPISAKNPATKKLTMDDPRKKPSELSKPPTFKINPVPSPKKWPVKPAVSTQQSKLGKRKSSPHVPRVVEHKLVHRGSKPSIRVSRQTVNKRIVDDSALRRDNSNKIPVKPQNSNATPTPPITKNAEPKKTVKETDVAIREIKDAKPSAPEVVKTTPIVTKDQLKAKKKRSIDAVATTDPLIKKIFESMKPIEKRKDGTLIDYGVKVPSRKKPIRQGNRMANVRNKSVDDIDVKQVVSVTQTKPKSSPSREKMTKTEKASKVNEPLKIENIAIKDEANKSTRSETKLQSEKNIEKDRYSDRKNINIKNTEPKKDIRTTSSSNINQPSEVFKPTTTGKVPLKGTPSSQPATVSTKMTDIKTATVSDSDGALKRKPVSLPAEKPIAPARNSSRTSMFPKPGNAEQPGKIPNAASSTDKSPFAGTINYMPPKGRGIKITKNSARQSKNILTKNSSGTGIAPLAGTIVSDPSKLHGKVMAVDGKEKSPRKSSSMDIEKKSTSRSKGGKLFSHRGKTGPSDSSGSSNAPPGPSSLKPSTSGSYMASRADSDCSVIPPIGSMIPKQRMHRKVGKMDIESALFNYSERPEKNILYSVWLQRFKNTMEDGKVP